MRIWVAGAITLFVWVLMIVRVVTGGGPMHDPQGNPAPTLHYVMGAAAVTAMTAAWVVGSAIFEKRKRG